MSEKGLEVIMGKLKRRNNKAKCPICGKQVVRGSSANWCPTFHYECEHVLIDGKDYLVAEFYAGLNDDFTVQVGYANTIYAPEGVSIRVHPPLPSNGAAMVTLEGPTARGESTIRRRANRDGGD